LALDPVRRQRIVKAATGLFSAYGYRRTSMDLLAREASVAKPTLYAYFDDKDAVFIAVVETVLDAVLADAHAAANSAEPLEERLAGILSSKFSRVFGLVHASPHAADLLTSSQASAREAVDRTDAAFRRLLASAVGSAIRQGEIDLSLASTSRPAFEGALMECGYGADALATSEDDHRQRIRRHVHLLLAGVQR